MTVLQAAQDMISSSDNTAADLLLTLVGRTAVESAAAASGMADPALDTPFLTTRELFVLKLDDWPSLAGRYLALGPAGRQAMLTGTVDRVPLSALHVTAPTGWTQPRDIGTLEWFASPADICRVYASLASLSRRPGLAPVASILEVNNGSLALDPRQCSTTWFKGGSEPGVDITAPSRLAIRLWSRNPRQKADNSKKSAGFCSKVPGRRFKRSDLGVENYATREITARKV